MMSKVGSNKEIGSYCAVLFVTVAIFGAIMLRG